MVEKAASERFRETLENIRGATADISGDYIYHYSLLQLVKLLEHLNILAIIEQLNLIHPRIHMVRVLKWSTSCRLVFSRMLQRRSSYFSRGYSNSFLPASLMIRYECGFVPIGLFPATIANLISNKLIIEENRVQF